MGLKLVRIGDHKGSPLPCYGFPSRGMRRGKGTFLHPEISLSVSFANNEPCAAGAPPRMKLILPYPNFRGSAKILRVREEHEIGYFVHYHTLSGDFRRKVFNG